MNKKKPKNHVRNPDDRSMQCWLSEEAFGVITDIVRGNRLQGLRPKSKSEIVKEALVEWCDARGLQATVHGYKISEIGPKRLPKDVLAHFGIE